MSVPQQQLIKKYFNLLVKEFITDPLHNKNISIVFKKYLGGSGNVQTLGLTERDKGDWHWKVYESGAEIPGSRWQEPFIYTISFLSHYENEEQLRGAVVHEFTHLYIYSKVAGKHDHDDRFYSTMKQVENWLDQNQKLRPRVDKSGDYYQYVGDNNIKDNDKENICPKCSYPSPRHSPQCSQNQNNPHPTNQPKPKQKPDITNDSSKAINLLKNLLDTSQDLATLESVYQNIKSNPLYQEENCSGNNKKELDKLYELKKHLLQSSNNNFSTNDSKNGLGGREYFLIALAVVGILLIVMIGYLSLSSGNHTKKKKK